ncbi:hypothetical protein EHS25_002433 [Saitozyma podzolica]|uniref:Uncharacterized protein n=1 Tax=Saitozyma podzolica TaxID=1890683 RepID=A0A427YDS9_9TREE|nr:hypothetical protein EHS25_002433 [Saitozyma podzolica]
MFDAKFDTKVVTKILTDIVRTAIAATEVLISVLDETEAGITIFFHLDSTTILRLVLEITKDGVQAVWYTFEIPVIIFIILAIIKRCACAVVYLQLERPLVRQLLLGLPMLLATGLRFGNTLQAATLSAVVVGTGLLVAAAAGFDALVAIICLAAVVSSAREHAAVLEVCLVLGVSSLAWNFGTTIGALAPPQMEWVHRVAPVVLAAIPGGIQTLLGLGYNLASWYLHDHFDGDIAAILFEVDDAHFDTGSLSVKLYAYDASNVTGTIGFIDRPGNYHDPYADPLVPWRYPNHSVPAPTATLRPRLSVKQEDFAPGYLHFNSDETIRCEISGSAWSTRGGTNPSVYVYIIGEVQGSGSPHQAGPRRFTSGSLPPRDKVIEVMYRPPPK